MGPVKVSVIVYARLNDCENEAKKIREKNASMSGIRQRRANSKVRFRVASYDRWIV